MLRSRHHTKTLNKVRDPGIKRVDTLPLTRRREGDSIVYTTSDLPLVHTLFLSLSTTASFRSDFFLLTLVFSLLKNSFWKPSFGDLPGIKNRISRWVYPCPPVSNPHAPIFKEPPLTSSTLTGMTKGRLRGVTGDGDFLRLVSLQCQPMEPVKTELIPLYQKPRLINSFDYL